MSDVFVSYKSEDRRRAEAIARALESEGLSVWWDPSLQSGQDYQEAIDAEIRSALVVVVLWSPRSVKSRWVRSEATVGDRMGALLPVMIEPCERPVAFELVQTADLAQWTGDRDTPQWRQFIHDVQSMLGRRRAQVAARQAPPPLASSELEALFWASIKDSADRADFASYLSRYPNGHFAELARRRLAALDRPGAAGPAWKPLVVPALVAAVVAGAAMAIWSWAPGPPRARVADQPAEQPPSTVPAASTAQGSPPSAKPRAAPADKIIRVWFAGSPHRAGVPSAAVPQRIQDTARTLGYRVESNGLEAAAFMSELLKAADEGEPPDIVFVDNAMHIEGGATTLGSIRGMNSVPALRSRLVRVNEALADLGRGWAFVVAGSPDHEGARDLVVELSGCATPMPGPGDDILRSLQLQAEAAARLFLACQRDASIEDPDALRRTCAAPPATPRRVSVCAIHPAPDLALVETAASIVSERELGRRSIVSVHRRQRGSWRVLVTSSDPVTTREAPPAWRTLAPRFGPGGQSPPAPVLRTPDGVLPKPEPGQRFGDFVWQPAEAATVAHVVEMNYGNDTRLFVLDAGEGRLSSGKLWTVDAAWQWRVWAVGGNGSLAMSETRTFKQ